MKSLFSTIRDCPRKLFHWFVPTAEQREADGQELVDDCMKALQHAGRACQLQYLDELEEKALGDFNVSDGERAFDRGVNRGIDKWRRLLEAE